MLGELHTRGVKFLTLRMRSPALIKQINTLTSQDLKTTTLDRPGEFNRPKVHESTGVRLSNYPSTVRQLILTGLGRDAPTVITNDDDLPTKALIEHYARRMTIEQRLAEIIQAFHADALSSTVNLNVDLDLMLCVLAQALTAALRARLPRLRRRHPRRHPTPLPRNPQQDHHNRRSSHRPPRPPRLRTRTPPGRPSHRHHRPLVGKPHPPLRVRLTPCPEPVAWKSALDD